MPLRGHLRTIVTVLAAMLAVLGLTLSMAGPAQAIGNGSAARSASGHAAHQKAAKPDGKVDQTQKSEQAHYTNAAVQPGAEGLSGQAPGPLLQRGPHGAGPPDHAGRRPAADGAGSGRHPGRLQPARLRCRRDGRDRGRVRRLACRGRPRAVPLLLRPPRLHGRERLPDDRQPGRRHQPVASGRPGLGPGDVARPRRRLLRMPELQDPPGAGHRQQPRQPRHRGRHRGVAGRQVRLELLRRPG